MSKTGPSPLYDDVGRGYAAARRTEPRIAVVLWSRMPPAATILNVGAGTGSYEPPDRDVMAVEPSRTMREQRPAEAAPCVAGVGEALPFSDGSFDVVMSVFSHWHWDDQRRGFAEMRRVARHRVLVIALDKSVAEEFWLSREYLPNAHALWGPFEDTLCEALPHEVVEVAIPGDCIDGFFHAFWRRPHVYLDPDARETMAVFRRIDPEEASRGLDELQKDLRSGAWHRCHRNLLATDSLDLGYRLLVHHCDSR